MEEEDKSNIYNIYNEIIYYFKEIGLLIYGEYNLKKKPLSHETICQKYYTFLNSEEIKPLVKFKLNHQICFLYYKNIKENTKIKLSINLDNLKINYYNFILICNLVHYYNENYESNTKEAFFLLELMKKFSIKIFKGEGIKDSNDGLILILLFLYYYSILAIHLYKNTQYIYFEDNDDTSNFFKFIKNRVNMLFSEYLEEDPEYLKYKKIFNNEIINLELASLSDYSERNKDTKLKFFTQFIEFVLFIMKNDEKKQNLDYSMIQYSEINPDVRINLFLRKAFFDIINVNAENIKYSLADLQKIKDKFFKNNENPEIEYYYKQIIQSNSNLLSFSKTKIDINEEKIKKIKDIQNLSKISQKYHEYNLKVLENNGKLEKEFEEEMNKNIFFYIICMYNDIALETKEYKKKELNKAENENEKDEISKTIYKKVESFCKYLKDINDKDKINFIKNNNYLKILISRIFYNYFVLKRIKDSDQFHKEKMDDTFESFKGIVHKFNINNFLVDKIYADYFFSRNEEIDKRLINYAKFNNYNKNISLSSLFCYAICSNEKKEDPEDLDNGFIIALNEISNQLSQKQEMLYLIPDIKQLLELYKQ